MQLLEFEKPIVELESTIYELERQAEDSKLDLSSQISGLKVDEAWAVALEETRLNHVDGAQFQLLLDQGDVAAYKVIHNFAILIAGRLRRVEDELLVALDAIAWPETAHVLCFR